MLYYCDVHRYEIVRQKFDGSGREVFIGEDVDNCEGLAVDWIGRNLYWTDDALGRISVARLDWPAARAALVDERDFNPRAIALDPPNGVMYWSVWEGASGGRGRIEVANMDGSQRRVLVGAGLHWPNGLVLDAVRQYLYWCDTYLNKIQRLHVTASGGAAAGAEPQLVLASTPQVPISKPYGLALYNGDVMWSEHGTGWVRRLERGAVRPVRQFPPPLYDIRLVSKNLRESRGNACSFANGGCMEVCLARGAGAGAAVAGAGEAGRTCACGAGRALAADGRSCVNRTAAEPPRCPPDHFHCGRGRCIDGSLVCDGDADCPDGSDEDSTPGGPCANVTCNEDQYMQCDTNRCIPKSWVCDGLKDCRDGSDESGAWCARVVCGAEQFACARSRRCLPAAWRCDGDADCGPNDDSDEADCDSASCTGVMFKCTNGACVPWEYYCDGHADCGDASDEVACRSPARASPRPRPPSATPSTAPSAAPSAAPSTDRAPHRPHSHYHYHDSDRGGLCEEHEYQCTNMECIRKEFRCDSRVDCLDGSDETDCGTLTTPPTSTSTARSSTAAAEGGAGGAGGCDWPALRCDNGTRCVPLTELCDGVTDCADGADEADRCGEPMCAVSGCSHACHPTPSGPACSCPAPLHLQRDRLTCRAAHVCADWGVCSQTCQPQKNRYRCTCYEGYRLADDGFTCKSTEATGGVLVFSNRHEVRAVELGSLASRALVSSLKNTIALDWRRAAGRVQLYWTDVVDDNIYQGTIVDNALTDIKVVVQQGLSTAEGLAVDWIAGNLYWVESSLHQIEVARADGQYRRTLIAGDIDSPRAIALDPRKGFLFWSDWEQSAPRIERATLAGRARQRVVRVDALAAGAWPNGIALDHRAERLYWIDARPRMYLRTFVKHLFADLSGSKESVELRLRQEGGAEVGRWGERTRREHEVRRKH
ncbi:low-density lipoprotein receptor-related protein 1-like [Zerene cesonia]|uniref:low-density lipoprotein receptor-related protein 1-like n=1 Tax=Zerene cesonia TaxID=33412 RepID=UPI0018E59D7F|nr:low-density lipoprotein receptor-related protein 1-like [Zerene cesonia]